MRITDSIYLAHHGIKGQKWGVRRFQNPDGTLTSAGKDRYSSEQFRRDTAVYGRSGARRIKKNVERRGESVSGARSIEARRIYSARRRAVTAGQIGAAVGSVIGGIGGLVGGNYAAEVLAKHGNTILGDSSVQLMVTAAVTGGMAKVGETLGRDGGRSIAMLASGYSPDRYQHG